MRGITPKKKVESQEKYTKIYQDWVFQDITLLELADEYDLTKQRIWQIITRCKLGDGDYYLGTQVARNKWNELNSTYSDMEEIVAEYNAWLKTKKVKTIGNNQSVVPHSGWDWKY
tara:strand:- start:255 stop:599 length:345 start_codon:yes stop_codon:yes gene_type:complete